jgi:hypothetical protein
MRINRGPRFGQLEWRRPLFPTVRRVLTHPNYAGAYVYGRKEVERDGRSRADRNRWRADVWKILLKDHLPAYISWDRYEANQKRLQANRQIARSPGVPRNGGALLAGLAVCGGCGRRLRAYYPHSARPYYFCVRHLELVEEKTCHGVTARVIDSLVVRQVHEALKPASLKLSLRAIKDSQKERVRLEDQWKKRLERAHYEVQRAERQYQAVEPENRLVARTLEHRWEAALLELRKIEDEFDRFSRDKLPRVTEAECSRITALSADIPALWEAESTTNADRKDIIRCLVDQVVVRVHGNTEYCDVTIHWKGGYTSQHQVIRPVRSRRQLRDGDRLQQRVTELRGQGQTAATIAARLTTEGFSPPRRGGTYSKEQVCQLVFRYGLTKKCDHEQLSKDEWLLSTLASNLKLSHRKLRDWANRKWCNVRQTTQGQWIVWADGQELDRLRRLKALSERGRSSYPTQLTTPKKRKN